MARFRASAYVDSRSSRATFVSSANKSARTRKTRVYLAACPRAAFAQCHSQQRRASKKSQPPHKLGAPKTSAPLIGASSPTNKSICYSVSCRKLPWQASLIANLVACLLARLTNLLACLRVWDLLGWHAHARVIPERARHSGGACFESGVALFRKAPVLSTGGVGSTARLDAQSRKPKAQSNPNLID